MNNVTKFKLIIPLVGLMIVLYCAHSMFFHSVYALYNNAYRSLSLNNFTLTKQGSFLDSRGMLNIVGVVDNAGTIPANIRVGLNVTEKSSSGHDIQSNDRTGMFPTTTTRTTTMVQPLFGKVIYPQGGSPFKFVIDPHIYNIGSKAFIVSIVGMRIPNYDSMLKLNYSNLASHPDGLLTGTAKNIGQLDLHNVSIYASAHDGNGKQIDSVKSQPVPLIRPGEEVKFIAIPNAAVKSKIVYYSCAGVDLNEPINTLSVGNGKFIAYDMQSIAKVSDFRYDNSTDSIKFGVQHYNPTGGPLTFRLAQLSNNHTVYVTMDGKPYPTMQDSKATINRDGKTIMLNLFIPKGEHQLVIRGVSDKGSL